MPRNLHTQTATSKTQAGGAFVFSIPTALQGLKEHQLQVEVSATPTAGTLSIGVKSVGASEYATLSSTIDLVNGPYLVRFTATAESIRITPNSFDAAKTYNVILNTGVEPSNV
ncbi:MAG: hypothetical protein M0P69_08760 [Bacteroidales bacterium]|nr:hypothetical protein [Bacteroidales bacterium]